MKTITAQARQNILERYLTFEGKIATAHFYFDTFSELVDQNLGNDKVEKLNGVLLEKIDEIMELLPNGYRLHVVVHIRNLGDYTLEEAQRIIKQNIALTVYVFAVKQRKKRITGLSLLAFGCVLLLVSYLLSNLAWPQILYDIINISGTLLVWESANLMLIEHNADNKRSLRYLRQFKEVRLVDEATLSPSDKEVQTAEEE